MTNYSIRCAVRRCPARCSSAVLERFAALYPMVVIELRIEGNARLAEVVDKGDLDLALWVGQADRALARTVGDLPLQWIAGEDFTLRPDQALPLLLLGRQCAFRKAAIAALYGLPELGSVPITLHTRLAAGEEAGRLRDFIEEAVTAAKS